MKEIVYGMFQTVVSRNRQLYNIVKRRRLNIRNISIISNNCLAGILYHDFNLRFESPTINLFFESDEDYIEYLSDLHYYSTTEPTEIIREEVTWPVGEIQKGEKSITIHFMHYKSFDEAKTKWIERGNRIDKDRLFVIWLVGKNDGPSRENYQKFKNLEYKNKLLVTGTNFPFSSQEIKKVHFMERENTPGKWAKYQGKCSNKRYIDEVDFVKCFNEME